MKQNGGKKPQKLTSNVGELVLQGADVCHIDVEERAELWNDHTYPGDGDVCQATAAVNWQGGQEGWSQKQEGTSLCPHSPEPVSHVSGCPF